MIQPSTFNYFGGSVGGLFHGFQDFFPMGRKHPLYFFTDWEDTLTHAASVLNTDVPTAAELGGDFSGPSPQGTPTPTIYDPTSTRIINGKPVRTPFQGNIIPKSQLDQVGLNLAAFFLNRTATISPITTRQISACGQQLSLHCRPCRLQHVRLRPYLGKVLPRRPNKSTGQRYSQCCEYLCTERVGRRSLRGFLEPHLLAAYLVRLVVTHVSEENFASPVPTSASSIGLQGVPLTQFPSISTNQYASFGAGSYARTRDGHYIYNDALILQLGRNNLSVGGEFIRYAYSYYTPGVLSGKYSFTGTFSSAAGQSGIGLVDLELGLPASTSISTTNTIFHEQLNYFSGYVQDDYRLSDRFTLNVGLRWEFDGPYSEIHNNMYSFNPNIIDPTTLKQGGIEFAGFNGAPHSLIANVYTGFLPRIGFNYHALRNTVIRGGYGVYELPSIGFGTTGLTSASTVSATFQSSDGVTPAYELDHGVPHYSPNVGSNGQPLIPTSLTSPVSSVVERQLTPVLPYVQEWQFGMQQDLGHDWIAEVDYEGNHGVHQPISLPINQIAPTGGCCFGLKTAQTLRPYPQFLTISYLTNGGASAYAALLAQLSHRWSNGVSVRAAYTWAHGLDDVDAPSRADAAPVQDYYNLHAQWGTAMTNIPQRFSLTAVYAVPIGSGGKMLNALPVLSQVIGHWRVSTVAQFQTGYPYTISQGDTLNVFSGGQYVTQVGNPNLSRSARTVQKWFNTAAFTATAPDTLGNSPRASLYGPGQNVWDIGLMRDVPIREHITLTFRADAHNAFNHPQFSGLGTSITSANYGQVTGAQDPRMLLLVGRVRF